jgi:hypothetical protein
MTDPDRVNAWLVTRRLHPLEGCVGTADWSLPTAERRSESDGHTGRGLTRESLCA